MKKMLLLIAGIAISTISFAQDTLVMRNGEKLAVKVVKSSTDLVSFQYPGEDMINEKSKKELKSIKYASGRVEECNAGFQIPEITSKDDWEKVVITYVESDVTGLTRVKDLKAKSGWGGAMGQSAGYKNCLKDLQKQAAKLGCGVVLVHGQQNQVASALGGGVNVTGTCYK